MIRMKQAAAALLASFALMSPAPVWAQPKYDVQTMNFDLWCQQTAHLPPDRCDKRTPEDEKTFEAYRAKVEQYEIPYLQEKQNQLMLDRDILHNDPVSHPLAKDPQAQAQSPNEQPQTPNP